MTVFDGAMEMDEGITRPWPAQLDAHEAELEHEAMMKHIALVAAPDGGLIVASAREPWFYSLIGWLCVGAMAFCIVAFGIMLQ